MKNNFSTTLTRWWFANSPQTTSTKRRRALLWRLSAHLQRKDKLEKRFAYLALRDLQLYLLIDSRRREVTGYYRRAQGWEERTFVEGDAVPVPCVGSSLSFGELYNKTSL